VVDSLSVPMENYFVLTILQLVLMIVFNDGCMITVAWDNVKPSSKPKRWFLDRLFAQTSVMAVVVTLLQVVFLFFGMAALQNEHGWEYSSGISKSNMNLFKDWFGIDEQLKASQLCGLMYVSLSWAGFLTLMSGRCEGWFFESAPGGMLAASMTFSMFITAIFGGCLKTTDIGFQAAPWSYIGVCFLFNGFAFLILDVIKVLLLPHIDRWFEDPAEISSIKMEVHRENRKRQETHNRQRGASRAGTRSVRDATRSRAASRAFEISSAGGSAASAVSQDPELRLRKKVSKLTQLTARLTHLSKDDEAKKILGELRALN